MTTDTRTTVLGQRSSAPVHAEGSTTDEPSLAARPGGPPGRGEEPPAPPGGSGPGSGPPSGPATAWWRAERLMPRGLGLVACLPLVALVLILVALVWKAMPAIRYNGFGFFSRSAWNLGSTYSPIVTTHGVRHPAGATYGAWPLIVGTLQSSFIALILAVPVGVGTALVVVEKLPVRLSTAVGFFLEVLAGIPSVVFGLWGAITFGPFLARHVAQPVADVMPNVPVLDFFRGEGPRNSAGYGNGLLVTGVVLAIMILPIIAATTRDLLRQVPRASVEGAVALGMTDTEAVRAVTLPWVRAGVVGASILGLGRALGETVAVSMLAGGITGLTTTSLYGAMTTIAATIVNELDAAFTDVSGLALSTMAELGLVLLLITLLANVGARFLVRRVSTTALPVGRGV